MVNNLLNIFQKLSELKPDIRPYLLEIETYIWLTECKEWTLEKLEFFTYDFKIKDEDIYIEVKKGYADLTQKQMINLYEYGKYGENEIKAFYLINDRKLSQDEGFIVKDSFQTIIGQFYLYEVEINRYLRFNNRLYEALISTRGMQSHYYAFGQEEHMKKIDHIFEKLRGKGLVDHIPFTDKPVHEYPQI